jgi:hypothetical protein
MMIQKCVFTASATEMTGPSIIILFVLFIFIGNWQLALEYHRQIMFPFNIKDSIGWHFNEEF